MPGDNKEGMASRLDDSPGGCGPIEEETRNNFMMEEKLTPS